MIGIDEIEDALGPNASGPEIMNYIVEQANEEDLAGLDDEAFRAR